MSFQMSGVRGDVNYRNLHTNRIYRRIGLERSLIAATESGNERMDLHIIVISTMAGEIQAEPLTLICIPIQS
jgi:hypothetical protein